jgi:hypothetical protein
VRSAIQGLASFSVFRALRHHGGISLLILLLAIVSVAAATVGPTYDQAARESIVSDVFHSASAYQHDLELSESGPIDGGVGGELSSAQTDLTNGPGGNQIVRLFQSAIESIEVAVGFTGSNAQFQLVYRTDVCRHLQFASGSCPTAADTIAVSGSLAASRHLTVGDRVAIGGWRRMRISGIYQPPNTAQQYWFGTASLYFPTEQQRVTGNSSFRDAAFTPRPTMVRHRGQAQGTSVVDLFLDLAQVHAGNLDQLVGGVNRIFNDQTLAATSVSAASGIPSVAQTIHASWSTLSVPVTVATLELVVLAWMLLFGVVSDAIEAKGTEVALVKLRGFDTGRTLRFAVAEPATLLVLALPIGAFLGWLCTRVLGGVLLRSGTPVGLTASGWLGGALATVGGLAAVVVASRRTVVRSVVAQWQRTGSSAPQRGWAFDAVVITGAVAGLIQMTATGVIGSSGHGGVILIAPALIALAIAVPAARLLPLAARASFAATARRRGLAAFLAVRTVARRPGGTRTTMLLATAFALTTFAIASWSVGQHNRQRVGAVTTGAADVLSVRVPAQDRLESVVNAADPSGDKAVAVLSYSNGPVTLLATQPDRFARVANWVGGSLSRPLASLPSLLAPPEPPPIALNGSAIRVVLSVTSLHPPSSPLAADIVVPGAGAPTPIALGTLRTGHRTIATARLPAGCGCELADLSIEPTERGGLQPPSLHGRAVLRGVSIRGANGWQPAAGALSPAHWTPSLGPFGPGAVTAAGSNLMWRFSAESQTAAVLQVRDRPTPLPAVVATPLDDTQAISNVDGLNGQALRVRPVAAANALPGAPSAGVLVDLNYARRAAGNAAYTAESAVWVAPQARATITKALQAHGVVVTTVTSQSAQEAILNRQGPGLASVLLLAGAAGAALLAVIGAVLSVAVTSRRRRYEYAALVVEGVRRRTLQAAIMVEQLIVLGYGAVVGIGAGIAATALSLSSVPEFVHVPLAPRLDYTPRWGTLLTALAVAIALLTLAAVSSSLLLVRSLDPDQLREGSP